MTDMISERLIVARDSFNNESNAFEYAAFARFRWYNYKEGFSHKLVEEALSNVILDKNDYILDPFNGNGTVTLTAASKGIAAVGIEVNPFSAFMSAVKLSNTSSSSFSRHFDNIVRGVINGKASNLLCYSTFSEFSKKTKWLFNSQVLNSFEGGWSSTQVLKTPEKKLFRLALLGAAMENCNAVKDGKCLKYRNNWHDRKFDKTSFLQSFANRVEIISEDLNISKIKNASLILNGDARIEIDRLQKKFQLCVTSPPYLNSFDYTDIYRPELFLGKFIRNSTELIKLRQKTLRSHVEIKLATPTVEDFGHIYKAVSDRIAKTSYLWDKQIPVMIQSYFEDMQLVLTKLKLKAKANAEIWIVVANSVYSGVEIPVDLILAEIGTKLKFKLVKIEVLRYIQRRKTKYNGSINEIRESLIVFKNC